MAANTVVIKQTVKEPVVQNVGPRGPKGDAGSVGGIVGNIQFDPNLPSNPAHSEALLFYDKVKHALSYYNDDVDITINMGQELVFPHLINNTGATIPNGAVVTPAATGIVLADRYSKSRSRLIAVVTHDIPNGTMGYATRLGQVGGIDTSSYTLGQVLYLGDEGAYATSPPTDGGYSIIVGIVDVVDAVEGVITVDPNITELTVEVTDTNGFPPDQLTATTLSMDTLTRTFTITPSGSNFHFYERGDKYEIIGADSVVITDLEGEHWLSYQDGVLISNHEPTIDVKLSIILNNAFVATVYWNQSDQKVEIDILEERHGISMSPKTHVYLHLTRGAQYISGFGIGDLTVDGSGNVDLSAQISMAAGTYFDEDITHTGAVIPLPASIPVVYNFGSNQDIRTVTNPGFAVHWAPAGTIYYNEWTGTTWQLTAVPNNDYVLYHIFAANGVNVNTISVMGQTVYGTINQARNGANTEISNIISSLPFAEMVPIGTLIFQANTSYTNAPKARIRSSADGDYVDWRVTELAQGTTPSSHANLTSVNVAATNEAAGHINSDLPLQLPELTTTERDLITPNNGMIIHNLTTGYNEAYLLGGWVTLSFGAKSYSVDVFAGFAQLGEWVDLGSNRYQVISSSGNTDLFANLASIDGKDVRTRLNIESITGTLSVWTGNNSSSQTISAVGKTTIEKLWDGPSMIVRANGSGVSAIIEIIDVKEVHDI